jgi:branched-chain amino acid transport system permease protein
MLNQLQIVLINAAIFFGHYVIISSALNFQFGNAGIPNMASNVSVAMGAYTVSAVVIRICMWIGRRAGLVFGQNWVYDNPVNVKMLNALFDQKPILGISLFLLSLALAFIFGSATGWFFGALSGRLRATRLMIFLLVISETISLIVANNTFIAGGTLGVFIPNFFIWYKGERMVIIALLILTTGLVCYLIMRTMVNSPYGRLIRAVRDNEITLESTGKNIREVRSGVMMFGSGIMAISGVLLSYYYSFVQYNMYDRVAYTFWPWLMITIGGLANNAGGYMGTLVCVAIIKSLSVSRQFLGPILVGTKLLRLVNSLDDIILASLLIIFLIKKPRGLVPEKNLRIRGIYYKDIISDKISSFSSFDPLSRGQPDGEED